MSASEVPLPARPCIPAALYALVAAILVERAALGEGAGSLVSFTAVAVAALAVCGALERFLGVRALGAAAAVVGVSAVAAFAGLRCAAGIDASAAALGSSPVSAWTFELVGDMSEASGGWRGRARGEGPGGERALVWLSCGEEAPRGATVSGVGRFKANTDDEWGRANRLQGICGSVSIFRLGEVTGPSGLPGALERMRSAARSALFSCGDTGAGALAAGVVCGDARELRALGLDDGFSACGASHLVAVSGSHLVLVGAMASAVLGRLGAGTGARAASTLLLGGLFVLFCGAPASAVRSWVMSAAAEGARAAGRRGHTASAVSAAGLGMVLWDPTAAGSLGFLLSVCCVGAISLFGSYARHVVVALLGPPRAPRRVPEAARPRIAAVRSAAYDALALTLTCQVASLPLTVPAFGSVSLIAPVANIPLSLLFGPLMAAGLLASALAAAGAPGALLSVVLAGVRGAGAAVLAVVRCLSTLPLAALAVEEDAAVLWAAVLAPAVALLVLWPRASRGGVALGLSCALLVCGCGYARWRFFAPARVCVMDVGQADSILVTDGAAALLVDAGVDGEVASALARNHVTHLDAVVLTHLDEDHVGGLDELRGLVGVDAVYVAEGVSASVEGELASTVESLTGGRALELPYGSLLRAGGWQARVVWPRAPVEGTSNADSIELALAYGDDGGPTMTALLTGDAERDETGSVLERGDVGRVDFLKVGHHGSAVSVTPEEAAALAPRVAVASAGRDNRYGHPRPECVDALEGAGAVFLCTKDVGDVTLRPGPEGPTVTVRRAVLE